MEEKIIFHNNNIEQYINNFTSYINSTQNYKIEIGDISQFELYIKGDRYEACANCDMLQSIIYLQNAINRIYCYINYNTYDVKKLTKQDKAKLELKVKINKGSSILNVDLNDIIKHAITTIGNNLSSGHIVIIIAMLIISFTTYKIFQKYCETKIKPNEEDRENNLLKNINEIIKSVNHNRFTDIVSTIKNEAECLYSNILKKSTKFEEGIKFNGYELSNNDVLKITKNTNNKLDTIPIRLDGIYRIIDINFYNEEEYKRLELECLEDNKFISKNSKLTVYLYEDLLAMNMQNISFKLTDKNIIYNFKINAELINDKITNAYVVDILGIN